jgi:hypothetical protein
MPERRQTAESLARLERLIEQMESLGVAAEDAAARITNALGGSVTAAPNSERRDLVSAIGDVIEIVTERSKLAHEAHRLIVEMRHRDTESHKGNR